MCNFCDIGEICIGDNGFNWSGVVYFYSYEGDLLLGVSSFFYYFGKIQFYRKIVKYGYSKIFYYEFMFLVNLVYFLMFNFKMQKLFIKFNKYIMNKKLLFGIYFFQYYICNYVNSKLWMFVLVVKLYSKKEC